MKTTRLDFSQANVIKRSQNQAPNQIPIFGSEMMSEPECVEYRTKIRSLPSCNARELFRLDHDRRMKLRSAEK
jgi:hypothetical protein